MNKNVLRQNAPSIYRQNELSVTDIARDAAEKIGLLMDLLVTQMKDDQDPQKKTE